jgi:hypothetical protein
MKSAAHTEPLTHLEVNELADYNTRVYQGIVHTDETRKHMAALQHRFNTAGWIPRRRRKLRAWNPDE